MFEGMFYLFNTRTLCFDRLIMIDIKQVIAILTHLFSGIHCLIGMPD